MTRCMVLIWGLLLVVFTGCSSKIPYSQTEFDMQDKAMAFVYRLESDTGEEMLLDVAVDSIVISLLEEDSFLPIELEPGERTIYVQDDDTRQSGSRHDAVILKSVKRGDVYYLKATVGEDASLSLELIETAKAQEEIDDTGYYYDEGFKPFKLYKDIVPHNDMRY